MKKAVVLILAVLMVLTFAACGGKGGGLTSSFGNPTGNLGGDDTVTFTPHDCMAALLAVKSQEDLEGVVVDASEDYFEQVRGMLGDDSYGFSLEKIADYQELELYRFKLWSQTDASKHKQGIEIFKKVNGRYVIDNSSSTLTRVNALACATCGGTGQAVAGGNVCSICGGTGSVYQQNVYFDPATNQWMGQHQACGACAGAGKIGSNTVPCGACGGVGVKLP